MTPALNLGRRKVESVWERPVQGNIVGTEIEQGGGKSKSFLGKMIREVEGMG